MFSEKESRTFAVVNCGQLVTLAGPQRPRVGPEMLTLGIITDGGLIIRDGRIEQVGTSAQIKAGIDTDTSVIDARTHPARTGSRAIEAGNVEAAGP